MDFNTVIDSVLDSLTLRPRSSQTMRYARGSSDDHHLIQMKQFPASCAVDGDIRNEGVDLKLELDLQSRCNQPSTKVTPKYNERSSRKVDPVPVFVARAGPDPIQALQHSRHVVVAWA